MKIKKKRIMKIIKIKIQINRQKINKVKNLQEEK